MSDEGRRPRTSAHFANGESITVFHDEPEPPDERAALLAALKRLADAAEIMRQEYNKVVEAMGVSGHAALRPLHWPVSHLAMACEVVLREFPDAGTASEGEEED
jgi:hypothetical protein